MYSVLYCPFKLVTCIRDNVSNICIISKICTLRKAYLVLSVPPSSTSSLHEIWLRLPWKSWCFLGKRSWVCCIDDPPILFATECADCSVHDWQELVLVVVTLVDVELARVHGSPFLLAVSQRNSRRCHARTFAGWRLLP